MKGKSDIDPTKYDNFSEAGLKTYLIEKYLGKDYQKKSNTPTPNDENDKETGFLAHLKRN